MIHLNDGKQIMTESWEYNEYGIYNYNETPDGLDVINSVNLKHKNLFELPFRFHIVYGDFDCSHNHLTSLRGSPKIIHGKFTFLVNNIQDLDHFPKFIGGDVQIDTAPWITAKELQKVLFSEIHGEIHVINHFFDTIQPWTSILNKYKNKKSMIPQAIKELRESIK